MKIKMILPALTEAKSPFWRPIKYSLFPPLGLATLAAFCYKDAFFEGGRSFYTQQADAALAEIDRLPGRHLYFLDDHLLGHQRFASALFDGMTGMNRVFQGASTIDATLRGDLVESAAKAGMRSVFVGFETLSSGRLIQSNKRQNLNKDYELAIKRLHSLGIMINGSFVFGLDDDDEDVFKRTVDWAVKNSLTTCTFHILTPYPGTRLYKNMEAEGRLLHKEWDLYDTRQVYAGGWKKFEPLWNFIIKSEGLNKMLPLLEAILSKVKKTEAGKPGSPLSPFPAIA